MEPPSRVQISVKQRASLGGRDGAPKLGAAVRNKKKTKGSKQSNLGRRTAAVSVDKEAEENGNKGVARD